MSASNGGVTTDKGCFYAKHETKFYERNMDELKAMVAHANPGKVKEIAANWKWIHDTLVGEDGRGGLRKEFDDAVKEVLEHWGGKAAEGFRQRANTISQNIGNSAPYASNMHHVMDGVGHTLDEYKKKIDAMEKPSSTESNLDAAGNYALKVVTFGSKGGRDDSKAIHELQQGKDTTDVLNGNSGELSEGKERQLQTAIMMEYLGSAYRSNVQAMGKPPSGSGIDKPEIDGPGQTPPPPPFVPLPDGVVNRPKPSAPKGSVPSPKGPGYTSPGDLEAPRQRGISGGVGTTTPPKTSTLPHVGTGLNSLPGGGSVGGGLTGGGGGGLAGGGGLSGVGGGGGHVSGGGSGATGIPGGGMPGGTMTGRSGTGGGGAAGAGSRSGRAGAPGMGGAAGAGGGAKGAAAGRGGALARQKGGVVGGTGGKTGTGGQGGSGLHRSRGGTQSGTGGGRRPTGMAGMPGAHGGKGKEKGPNGERPDYLVEDEETWTPERNVAPKVIE
ncbi:hypothetical protein [Streptomyces chrestomyceticus]|uniref:Uncharacterized protein n=1 Tax=Streptomyces chrestomyceticus TaxID=68185 RepID=A0ABU7X4E5_9ACTN